MFRLGRVLLSWPRQCGAAYNGPPRHRRLSLFLKSIELAGFKSFERPVRLELSRGITALVGANGSGKSNIVDAVRWCIGEQNMRDLRGQRAEDLIFAGQRRLLGTAEVNLVFGADVGDDVTWAELSVGRRLHRPGDSEYLLNGDRVRLRDLTATLRDIGVGGTRSVVVNQGMADGLLAASPMETRLLLEHAAGLSGYRARRDEARAKLSTNDGNLRTIEVVLAEMEPGLRLLRRQARAVEDRDAVRARLHTALRSWYAARWKVAREACDELARAVREAEGRRRDHEQNVRSQEEIAERALAEERGYAQQLAAARASWHAAQRASDEMRFKVQSLDDRVAALHIQRDGFESRLESLAREEAEKIGELESLTTASHDLTVQCEQLSKEEAQITADLQGVRGRLSAAERESTARAAARNLLALRAVGDRARVESVEIQLDAARRAADAAAQRTDALMADRERHAQRVATARRQLEVLNVDGERLAVAHADCLDRFQRSRVRLGACDRIERRLSHQQRDCARRLQSARALLAEAAAATECALVSTLEVAPGWERAVAAALAPWATAQGRELEGGTEVGDFLQWRDGLPGADGESALWGDCLVHTEQPGAVRVLLGTLFVRNRRQAEVLWNRLSPRAAHTIGSPPIQVVSVDGSSWSAVGVELESRGQEVERLLRVRREIDDAQRRLKTLGSRLQLAEALRLQATAEVGAAEGDLDGAKARVDQQSGAIRDAARLLEEIELTAWKSNAEMEAQSRARDLACESVMSLDVELERLRSRCAETEREAEQHMDSHSDSELSGLRETVSAHADRLAALRVRGAENESRAAMVRRSAEVVRSSLDQERREKATLLSQCGRTDDELRQLSAAAHASREQLTRLGAAASARGEEVAAIERERPLHRSEDIAPGIERAALARAMADHERLLAQYAHADAQSEALRAEIASELGIDPDRLPSGGEEVVTDDEIRRLRSRAAAYQEVDETVIGEYRELADRYARLHEHLEDLRAAADDLEGIIARADREMDRRFTSSFAAVNEEFSRIFRLMLRGGDASLEVADPPGGIAIRAQLPGRRSRANVAFSGGERTLVASCLLFGVLHMSPAPFCVLDEVDAALDETNVDRYLDALRDIGGRTQIVVVTHNRATMAAADSLYGVTMDGNGSSSILSLNLAAYGAAG